jgi:hypothetical protein
MQWPDVAPHDLAAWLGKIPGAAQIAVQYHDFLEDFL